MVLPAVSCALSRPLNIQYLFIDLQIDILIFLFIFTSVQPERLFLQEEMWSDKFSLIWILTKGKKKKTGLNITTGIHNTTLIFIITIMHNMARMLCLCMCLFLWVMQNLDRSHFLPLQLSQLEFCCCAMLRWHCTGS